MEEQQKKTSETTVSLLAKKLLTMIKDDKNRISLSEEIQHLDKLLEIRDSIRTYCKETDHVVLEGHAPLISIFSSSVIDKMIQIMGTFDGICSFYESLKKALNEKSNNCINDIGASVPSSKFQ